MLFEVYYIKLFMRKLLAFLISLLPFFVMSQGVGIGTTAPGSTLTVNGSFASTYKLITLPTPPPLDATDFYVAWNAATNGTLTLPSLISGAGNYRGRLYTIRNNSANRTLTLRGAGTELIDSVGGFGVASLFIRHGESVTLMSTGGTSPTGITWAIVQQGVINSPAATFWNIIGNSTPALSFLGTIDNQELVVRTNNIEKMRMLTNGNVGIGITSPLHRLQLIHSGITTDSTLLSSLQPGLTGNAGSRRAFMKIGRSLDNNNAAHVGFHYSVLNSIQNYMGFGFRTGGIDSNRMVVRADGHTGIGTSAPGSKLTVNGSFGVMHKNITSTPSAPTLDSTDFFVSWSNATNGSIILPSLRTTGSNLNYRGRIYHIKNNSTLRTLTVQANGSERIDISGGTTATSIIVPPGESIQLISTGNAVASGISWELVSQNIANVPMATFWKTTGNMGTNITNHFLGTSDAQPLMIRTNNTARLKLTTIGYLTLSGSAQTNTVNSRLLFQNENNWPTEEVDENKDDYVFESYGNSYNPNIPPPAGATTQNLVLRRAAGSVAAPLALSSGHLISQIVFDPYLSGTPGGFRGTGAKITSQFMGMGTNGPRTDLRFYTSSGDVVSPAILPSRMIITPEGNVGIGQENNIVNKLQVKGSFAASYYSSSGATDFNSGMYCVTTPGNPVGEGLLRLPATPSTSNPDSVDSRIYVIRNKNRFGNSTVIDPNGSETIHGLPNFRLPPHHTATIMRNNDARQNYDGGTQWNLISVMNACFERFPFEGAGGETRLEDAEDNGFWRILQCHHFRPPPQEPYPADSLHPRLSISNSYTQERMAIFETGQVRILGVEDFVEPDVANPNILLAVNGSASKPGGGDWSNFSDIRVKRNIQPYKAGLKEILAINPVNFQYNGEIYREDGKNYVGIIAQDIEKVLPGTVTKTDTKKIKELRHFDGSELKYTLINAIKEQDAQIEQLNEEASKLDQLEQKVNILKADRENLLQLKASYDNLVKQIAELKNQSNKENK